MELQPTELMAAGLEMRRGRLTLDTIVNAAVNVNKKLKGAVQGQLGIDLDLYEIIDLRMLSGMIGEMFAAEIVLVDSRLVKNPNIDGYPDLCDVSSEGQRDIIRGYSLEKFLSYEQGGFEVKNTFGVKKSKTHVASRDSRVKSIQKQLVWKAHHRETNHLIALYSDYVDSIPQIVACFYSDNLTEEDWTEKQQPKEGSTMTSFCQTRPTAYEKLKSGVLFCAKREEYEKFIGL